jgi:hypothetical protein
VFLWALKLYAFCNKNIKKHGREFMLKYRKFWGSYKSIHPSLMLRKLLLKSCVRTACFFFSHILSALVIKGTWEAFNCYLAAPGAITFLLSLMMEANDFNNQLKSNSSSINGT